MELAVARFVSQLNWAARPQKIVLEGIGAKFRGQLSFACVRIVYKHAKFGHKLPNSYPSHWHEQKKSCENHHLGYKSRYPAENQRHTSF